MATCRGWRTGARSRTYSICCGRSASPRSSSCCPATAAAFDAWGERYELLGSKTLFYLVERGPGPETLDTALLEQARGLGVEVRFNSRLDHLEGPGVLAAGPKAADAIAVG